MSASFVNPAARAHRLMVPVHLHYRFGTLKYSRARMEAEYIVRNRKDIAQRIQKGEAVTIMAGDGAPITFNKPRA